MSQMDLLGDARARITDPSEARDAAARMLGRPAADLERRVLEMLAAAERSKPPGLTTREMAERSGIDRVSISPRMKPLERAGLVEKDGTRREGSAVYRIKGRF